MPNGFLHFEAPDEALLNLIPDARTAGESHESQVVLLELSSFWHVTVLERSNTFAGTATVIVLLLWTRSLIPELKGTFQRMSFVVTIWKSWKRPYKDYSKQVEGNPQSIPCCL